MAIFSASLAAKEITIALVGKTKNDSFYLQSYKGCITFAASHPDVQCVYDGAADYQDVRSQVIVVNELAESGIDGLLISISDSAHLARDALQILAKKNIPVITFDSDLLPEHHQYRLAYVGTNNFDFGVELGEAAKAFKHVPLQQICIQSGHQTTPNLNARIAGVRFALSGQREDRLTGQNGWQENDRCPLYSLGRRQDALNQLLLMLQKEHPPIFLAVAGFAQFNPDYADKVAPFKQAISSGKSVIISADTEDSQLVVLNQGLSTVNIGQKPFEMGRLSAELMYQYIKEGKKPAQEFYYLDYHYCRQDNTDTCTTNF
ncbi:substrate-binding domain-containing protein [Aliiglaciecola sp. CAU 1673]|uniref:substrate-binding domain-containing protein n=1 Tax=Aliiglaciecola sp. CAU 1673 TaxID=3032595 RepID=UPI0023DBF2B7|nr:substrate-binding domain-containing protein [Aliiglaciecola sp. CAU 1673]MDF2177004.1 substrate-binding domain-containing protein [Aliiglaciecola sp. CAU 1673]